MEAKNFHVDIILKGWAGPTPPLAIEHMLGRAFVSSLRAGRTKAVAFPNASIPPGIPPGNYEICAVADSTGVVLESNEGNNSLCQSIRITERVLKPALPPRIPKKAVR